MKENILFEKIMSGFGDKIMSGHILLITVNGTKKAYFFCPGSTEKEIKEIASRNPFLSVVEFVSGKKEAIMSRVHHHRDLAGLGKSNPFADLDEDIIKVLFPLAA